MWNFANSKRGVSRIPGKLNDNNCVYTTPKEIVDAFAQSFSRFFSEPSSLVAKDLPTQFSNFCISRVSEKKLLDILCGLSNKLTSGEDQIPSFLIKDCRQIFTKPLCFLINLAISSKVFPDKWKIARITPVFKKGDKSSIVNYRPISIVEQFQ